MPISISIPGGGGGGGTSVPVELGYAAITADLTTTSDSMADATGLSITITVGSRPIIVEFWSGEVYQSVDQKRTLVELYDNTGAARVALGVGTNNGVSGAGVPMFVMARLAPAAGSRTYKIRWSRGDVSGTSTMRAAATSPAFIRAYEIAT